MMALVLTVDRIEGDVAVVETATGFVDLPLSFLPPGVGEGDRVRVRVRALASSEARSTETLPRGAAVRSARRSESAGGPAPAPEKP